MKHLQWLLLGLVAIFATGCQEEIPLKTGFDYKYWLQVSINNADGANILSEADGEGLAVHTIKYEYNGVCKEIGQILIDEPWFNQIPGAVCTWHGAGIVANDFSYVADREKYGNLYDDFEWFRLQDSSIFIGEWSSDTEASDTIRLIVDGHQFEIVYKMVVNGSSHTQYIYVDNEFYQHDYINASRIII